MNTETITERSNLLGLSMEIGYSTQTISEIMLLFKNIEPQQKETVAVLRVRRARISKFTTVCSMQISVRIHRRFPMAEVCLALYR